MLQTVVEKEKTITKKQFVQVFIVKPKKLKLEILSKSLESWVSFSVEKYPFQILEYDGKEKITEFVKPFLTDCEYTVIISATTPLLQEKTIDLILNYVSAKQSKATKLSVGYVFDTKYLKESNEIFYDSLFTQNEDEFYIVENKRQLNVAKKILIERINNFHLENGVEIVNPNTVTIEPDVFIGENVTIYPNNTLKGNTEILDNVILKENNVIEDSIIGKSCCIINSKIENSVVGEQSFVKSFCTIRENSQIGAYSVIESYCDIENSQLKENTTLKSYTKLLNGEEIV